MSETKKRDVARGIILTLLVLTILISVVSTWVILDTVYSFKYQQTRAATNQKGYVGIEVMSRPAETISTGQVTLEVLPKQS